MSKLTMAKIVEIFADFLDAGVGLGRMFGVSFVKQDDKNKGTPKYSLQFHGTGDVEVALQKAQANNIIQWIDEASEGKLAIKDGNTILYPNDDEVMFALAEIPKKERVEIYTNYNKQGREEFCKTLVRLMVRPTKRMKFLTTWLKKVKPALEKSGQWLMGLELSDEQKLQIDQWTNEVRLARKKIQEYKKLPFWKKIF